MQDIKIGNLTIGQNHPAFVIAEIGSNHNQSLQLAYETIDAAKEAGADAVKFQSIDVNKLYLNPSKATIDLHKKIDLPEEWHYLLSDYCKKKEIVFFSSPTYLEAVDILETINVSLYKLASAQIGTFPQLVEKVAQTNKPVILSTGLVSYAELEKIVKIFHLAQNNQFIILHCNSIYPTPYEKVHLPLMHTYQKMFDCIVGFSDHTAGIYAPIIAVAQGAKVIEKHFAISRKLPVPDAPFSLEPHELREMINGIRIAEQMLIPQVRLQIEKEEANFKKAIGTKLVLAKNKNAGEPLQREDFIFRRHSEGIDCKELDRLLLSNFFFKENVMRNTLLDYQHISL
ncbi:N-acetylneuraminate synthase family protein [Hugenholtzia roseola]|uniref:N-acetylneuraminate synthase family protein n=1 Tax=Hugenholtzia roseola TaxID=1002 RepID=UPI00042A3900|nr:N-acetylneuraminate synthase family protein [Hugenholtzia roseola]